MDDLMDRNLEAPCDRLLGLVDRHAGDFLWGIFLPEVLGAVENVTHTRGYVVATMGSVNQVFTGPGSATLHEFYHLLGCPHGMKLTKCYRRIAELKSLVEPGAEFVPGVAKEGEYIATREAANDAIRKYLLAEEARRRDGAVKEPASSPDSPAGSDPPVQASERAGTSSED